jgi:hypothetical protein
VERLFWTDERLDDVIARIDGRFDRIEDRMERGFSEIRHEMSELGRELRGEIAAGSRQLTQIGWALVGILIVQLIAAVVALS